MPRQRAGVLAVRAVNQYRRRDVLSYLALRYYLNNEAARTDRWANEVATDLVLKRSDQPYFRAYHFKDGNHRMGVEHRPMFLPCANEALAEAALLAECARHPIVFGNPDFVFSYQLATGEDRSGIFGHYSAGLRNRHDAIAQACDDCPEGTVRYLDLKKFYPSVHPDLALKAWRKAADQAEIAPRWRELGDKFIGDHAKATDGQKPSILTGPMFSHLIGNLVLRDIDAQLAGLNGVKYFRYVDDITLVGRDEQIRAAVKTIRSILGELGLKAHDDDSPKSLIVPCSEWVQGRHDFQDRRRPVSWKTLIGDLKRHLLAHPDARDSLHDAFVGEGMRIPVRDYSEAIFERGYLQKIQEWSRFRWFWRNKRKVSTDSLIDQARQLRIQFESEFKELVGEYQSANTYGKKRLTPKIRYRSGRLTYLATDDALFDLAKIADSVPELHLQSMVMAATATRKLDGLLELGTNAAQAVAQPLRAAGKTAHISLQSLSDAQMQALAVFQLNGVAVQRPPTLDDQRSEMLVFSEQGGTPKLMRSPDKFIREIACLHGLSKLPRHPSILESVFDEDEELAVDAVEQLQESISL
jgi:hypothetical protein